MTWGGTDLFLAELNSKHLQPTEYAWQLKVKHNLTRQQTLAIAPVVQCLQQMHSNRINQMTHLADGVAQQPCRCVWLVELVGAAKIYSYTKVIRPMLQYFCGAKSYVATAPTHAPTGIGITHVTRYTKWPMWAIKLSAKGKLACRLVNAKFSESKQVLEDEENDPAHGRVGALLCVWTHRHLYNLYYPIAHKAVWIGIVSEINTSDARHWKEPSKLLSLWY